jgi:hypothetical protein
MHVVFSVNYNAASLLWDHGVGAGIFRSMERRLRRYISLEDVESLMMDSN